MYPTQGSVTLLAHKTDSFICNGGGPKTAGAESRRTRWPTVEAPRTAELDHIGAVVSNAHPPAGTFLASSTAEVLIER